MGFRISIASVLNKTDYIQESVLGVLFTSQSTAMVMGGRLLHLLGKLEQAVNQYFVHILLLVTDNNTS